MSSTQHQKFVRSPTFGYDPWLNPDKDPMQVADHHDKALAAGRLYNGQDALTGNIRLFPKGLDYYGSYVDNFGGYGELVAWAKVNAPHAFLLSYTIFGNPALCADVEPGAMSPSSLPQWFDHVAHHDSQGFPWVYTSAGNWSAVDPWIGNRKVIRIGAHYGFGPHVCAPNVCGYRAVDWTQWADHGPNGEGVDQLIGRYLPEPPIPKPPKAAGDNAMIAVVVNENQHSEVYVEAQPSGPGKTGEVFHNWKEKRADGTVGWAGWASMGKPN